MNSSKVTVCRGCCRGTAVKHPGIDHEGRLRVLRDGVRQVRVADCLDSMHALQRRRGGRHRTARSTGARPVWFGGVLTEEATRDIAAWITAGGPGEVDLPARLAHLVIDRSAED